MTLTVFSDFINNIFSSFDSSLLGACHSAAGHAGAILTPLARAVTFIGEKGIIFFALALLLVMFKKTRRTGVCLFGAVCCGALIGNIILKDLVARPRPLTTEAYSAWWSFVGSPAEDGFSFPSGHVTAAMAGVTALCLLPPQNDAARLHLRVADGILPLLPHGSLPLRCHGGYDHRRHLGSHCILHRQVDIHPA